MGYYSPFTVISLYSEGLLYFVRYINYKYTERNIRI